jgi:transcriptional regulator with GAF, ATPase, and Fis domain
MNGKTTVADWADRFRTLVSVGSTINSSLELEPTLAAILESVTEAMDSEGASILLVEDGGKLLRVAAATGAKAKEARKIELPMGEGIAGWVASRGESLLVGDAASDSRHQSEVGEQVGMTARSILAVPIANQGQVIGTLEVLNPRSKPKYERMDQEFLEALATQVAIAIRNATTYTKLDRENRQLKREIGIGREVVGEHPAIRKALGLVERVAPFDVSVLITGASGTGKELFARAIHNGGARADGPFVDVNCTAIPDTLLESELFGHVKGAFTGAVANRKGKFELADGGTLFLDEIGDMSPEAQSKLLRALEERNFVPVGAEKAVTVDLRVLAATNRDLEAEARAGNFREDLYYRLNEFQIHLPPLCERKEDVRALAIHFLAIFSRQFGMESLRWSPEALSALADCPWPGNVRELRNAVKSAIILAEGETVGLEALPRSVRVARPAEPGSVPPEGAGDDGEPISMAELEKRHLERVLNQVQWNKSRAARILGISRPTVDAKLKAYKIKQD